MSERRRGERGLLTGALAITAAVTAAAVAGCGSNDHGPPQFTGGGGDTGSSAATFAQSSSSGSGFGDFCDNDLDLAGDDAMDGARAIGLCSGVTNAAWTKADGTPLGMGDGGQNGDGDLSIGKGILPAFGDTIVPREGSRLLALSSGAAREPDDAGFHSVTGWWKDTSSHTSPAGYPKPSPSCPNVVAGGTFDSAGLRVTVQPPEGAKSLAFDFNFYTFEFPMYICSTYNDFFVAMMSPKPAGLADENISFDELGNTISVNAGFLKVCHSQIASDMKLYDCPDGPGALAGTGFDTTEGGYMKNSASTGWLTTTAPIADPTQPITLQFSIWDAGDGRLDSTVLVDNFRFDVEASEVGTHPAPK